MLGSYSGSVLVAALVGMGLGAACYWGFCARMARRQRRIPRQWQLRTRPLFSGVERTVWHWLERVFFDHHVLVKIPVLRFMSPRSATQGSSSYELLKGMYCSFTICTSDGRVIGCMDVPGSRGLKASNRDVKKKLFEECGIAYAVLSAHQLPTLEALRAAFLGDMALPTPFSQPADVAALPVLAPAGHPLRAATPTENMAFNAAQPGNGADRPVLPQGIDMIAVAAARSSLQSKLDQNRKVRLAKMDESGASLGIVDDKAGQKFAAPWDDSFIMGEEARTPER